MVITQVRLLETPSTKGELAIYMAHFSTKGSISCHIWKRLKTLRNCGRVAEDCLTSRLRLIMVARAIRTLPTHRVSAVDS